MSKVKKSRKRSSGIAVIRPEFSGKLHAARELIHSGKKKDGLSALNQLAASTRNPTKLSKILLLVGESESTLSRHDKASAAFSRASHFARQANDYDLLLRAGIGQVRALLRSLHTEDAKTAATQLQAGIHAAQDQIDAILRLTPAQLVARGNVSVPARPPRSTVVLTKIANAFIESGLTDDARLFLLKAIQLSPNGASRARQTLAKLALASDEPALAERYARESLLMGRFQSKTVAAWQLYLDSRARQNLVPILEPDVFASFQANAKGRIASASIHSIARVLRSHGDPTWKGIAQAAIASPKADAIICTELEKMIHADAKLTRSEDPITLAVRALKLFKAKGCSAREQIAHAKSYVHYSFEAAKTPELSAIVKIAAKLYGTEHAIALRHTAALGAMHARKHDIARNWLNTLIGEIQIGSDSWGKATWALARWKALLRVMNLRPLIITFKSQETNKRPPVSESRPCCEDLNF